MMLLHCKTLYWKVVKWQQVNGTNQILGLQEKQEDHALALFGEAGVVFFQLKYFYWQYGSVKLLNVHDNYLLIGRQFYIMFIPWTGFKFVTTKISCALNAQLRLLSPFLGLVYHRHVCFHIFWGKPFVHKDATSKRLNFCIYIYSNSIYISQIMTLWQFSTCNLHWWQSWLHGNTFVIWVSSESQLITVCLCSSSTRFTSINSEPAFYWHNTRFRRYKLWMAAWWFHNTCIFLRYLWYDTSTWYYLWWYFNIG